MEGYITVCVSFKLRVNDVAGLSVLYHMFSVCGHNKIWARAQGRELTLTVFYKKKKTQSLRLANSEANHGSFT